MPFEVAFEPPDGKSLRPRFKAPDKLNPPPGRGLLERIADISFPPGAAVAPFPGATPAFVEGEIQR